MNKRLKRIEIAVSEDEYNMLLVRKTKPRLAEWIRETVLQVKPKRKNPFVEVDPRLLYEINRIGVNLNQIARECNRKKADINLVNIALSLRNIEKKVFEILK